MEKNKKMQQNRRMLLLFFLLYFIFGKSFACHADVLNFTEEEKRYIAEATTIKAASIDGAAPHHYINSRGEVSGIAIEVLNEIAQLAGLSIEYCLYDSVNTAFNSGADIFMGVSKEYAPAGLVVSRPYLRTEAVLFYNSAFDPNRLHAGRYVGIEGGTLPKGVNEKTVLYLNNREDTFDAVEKGVADYGFGNAYSLSFYLLQNGYKNIITVPTGQEDRAYGYGSWEENGILISIIDKCLARIDESRIETLILKVASQIERKLSFATVFDAFGGEIIGIVLLTIVVLSISVVYNVRANKRLKLQNTRYEALSSVSNEFFFEYYTESNTIQLSEKFAELLDSPEERKELGNRLLDALNDVRRCNSPKNVFTIYLPFPSGRQKVFKVTISDIYDQNGVLYSIIGKLTDISREIAEKEELISKSRLDGLTKLYNATTAKELITADIGKKSLDAMDAFIIIDCDNFKEINDTFGHLTGNLVLKDISESLRFVFRKTDIMGRIGGDEFCVYMHDVASTDLVRRKCIELKNLVKERNRGYKARISIGIAITNGENTYEALFRKADDALYLAKKKGGNEIVVFGDSARTSLS